MSTLGVLRPPREFTPAEQAVFVAHWGKAMDPMTQWIQRIGHAAKAVTGLFPGEPCAGYATAALRLLRERADGPTAMRVLWAEPAPDIAALKAAHETEMAHIEDLIRAAEARA